MSFDLSILAVPLRTLVYRRASRSAIRARGGPSRSYALALAAFAALACTAVLAAPDDDVRQLQRRWETIKYTLPASEQEKAFSGLAEQAREAGARNPGSAEVKIWEGIALSSYAGAKGGLGALSLVKEARVALEKALVIDDRALAGSAYTSLGALYYQVPGWPIGFGDAEKARTLLQKALAINPQGMDPNFFYGDFLLRQKDYRAAVAALEKAREAPARPDRPLADEGRRREIEALIEEANKNSR